MGASHTGQSSAAAAATRVEDALSAPLSSLGLDIEAVEVSPAGKRRVLRIAVDKDGGVTLDEIAEATRAVGEVLDGSDVMGQQPYTLEVTSRGVDRPLTLPRHWRRNRDRLVKVVPHDGEPVVGRILESDEHRVVLEVAGTTRELPFEDVRKALVQVEFNRRRAATTDDPAADDDPVVEHLTDEHLTDEHGTGDVDDPADDEAEEDS